MYVKYQMNSGDDYRGNVKLVVRVGDVEIAYSNVVEVGPGMVLLTPTEIELVNSEAPGLWLTEREEFQRRLDEVADEIRASYLYNGPRSISEEYRQVETVTRRWIAQGSPSHSVPEELSVWAQLNDQTAEWAAQSVLEASEFYRGAILALRTLRLTGKREMRTIDASELQSRYEHYVAQMRQYRCPIEY